VKNLSRYTKFLQASTILNGPHEPDIVARQDLSARIAGMIEDAETQDKHRIPAKQKSGVNANDRAYDKEFPL
jgi:hypothetical protein